MYSFGKIILRQGILSGHFLRDRVQKVVEGISLVNSPLPGNFINQSTNQINESAINGTGSCKKCLSVNLKKIL